MRGNGSWRDDSAMSPRRLTAFIGRLLVAALLIGIAMKSQAEDGMFYGLMRERDLTPFGFMRLDMRPAHAVSTPAGSWSVETDVAFQNTWALSPEVENYLVGLEANGRRE